MSAQQQYIYSKDINVFKQLTNNYELETSENEKQRQRVQIKFIAGLLILAALCFEIFPNCKTKILIFLQSIEGSQYSYIYFILIGVFMMLTALPFFFFEMMMGYVTQSYGNALIIIIPSKIIGIFLCYAISYYYLRIRFHSQIKSNKYFNILKNIQNKKPKQFLIVTSIMFLPDFLQIYMISMLNSDFAKFCQIYIPIKLLIGCLYAYFGYTAENINILMHNVKGEIFVFTLFFTSISIMIYMYIYQNELIKENEQQEFQNVLNEMSESQVIDL